MTRMKTIAKNYDGHEKTARRYAVFRRNLKTGAIQGLVMVKIPVTGVYKYDRHGIYETSTRWSNRAVVVMTFENLPDIGKDPMPR